MRALLDEMLKAFSTGDIDADVDAVKEELVKLDFLPDDIFDDIGGRCTDCGRRLPDDYQQALCPPCFRAQAFGDFTTQGD